MDTDSYYMHIANAVADKSVDGQGCVIVDENGVVKTTGYSSTVGDIYITDREAEDPEWMIGAEENAIINAGRFIHGCTAYLNKHPSVQGLKSLVQAGVNRVCYGPSSVDTRESAVCDRISRVMEIEMINFIC